MGVNSKMLASIKCYVKLLSTKTLYCYLKHIAVMWKSPVGFPKLTMGGVFVYLLKHKFYFNKNWIFVASYSIQKLKTKTCFSHHSDTIKTVFSPLKDIVEIFGRSFIV